MQRQRRTAHVFVAVAALMAVSTAARAATPEPGWQSLFNGRDLSGWDTWLGVPHRSLTGLDLPKDAEGKYTTALGLNVDPRGVYSVAQVDGAPAIRISGEIFGALTGKKEYDDFHLRLEFKWGEKKWAPRENTVRDSGILYYAVGEHGASGGNKAWMRSLECQVQEHDTGDFWSVAGPLVDVTGERTGEGRDLKIVFKPGAPVVTVDDATRRAIKAFDNEKPSGRWNTVEVACVRGTCVHAVNGKVNLVLTNPRQPAPGGTEPLRRGRLQIQSEGAEVYYRDIAIRPISTLPEAFMTAATPAASPGLLLVVNKKDRTLSIIDPEAGREVGRVEESGVTGHEVVASPDGRVAYVPIYGDSGVGRPGSDGRTMDVIDIATSKRVATVDFGRGDRPHHPLFGPDGRLYVTTEMSQTITVVDPRTHQVVDRIPTGQAESHMVALTRDGKRAYTSNAHAGTVSAIDLVAKKVIAVIPISSYAQRIALSVDDSMAFTADQTAPRLAVIDTATNSLKQWVALPGIAYGTAPTPDGRHLVMALIRDNKVGVLDLKKMDVVRTFDVPAAPQEVLVRPDGRKAYVSCDQSGKVAVIDLVEWKVEKLIDAGPLADGLAWAAVPRR